MPTERTRAVTGLYTLQSLLEHTVKVRRLSIVGGVIVAAASFNAGARSTGPPNARRRRSCWWSIRSKCAAARPRPARAARMVIALGAAPATTAALRSAKGALSPGTPPADCATTRYSTFALVEPLAGKDTQPESVAGSIAVSAPAARLIAVATLRAQRGSDGAAAVSAQPASVVMSAAARTNPKRFKKKLPQGDEILLGGVRAAVPRG